MGETTGGTGALDFLDTLLSKGADIYVAEQQKKASLAMADAARAQESAAALATLYATPQGPTPTASMTLAGLDPLYLLAGLAGLAVVLFVAGRR